MDKIINGVSYDLDGKMLPIMAKRFNGMPYCIVRTNSNGTFVGYLKDNENGTVLKNARYISTPEVFKRSEEIDSITLYNVFDIEPVTARDAKMMNLIIQGWIAINNKAYS